ncbi:MAG TPA: phosphodiester glycosidase family protein [Longimicrobiaceae bacterium]|nr:phosphodiester glycosidase family protein [Longimicrobiaceae bacterium]
MRWTVLAAACLLAAGARRPLSAQGLPPSELRTATAAGWMPWWNAARAPATWGAALPRVAGAVRWRTVRPGLEVGELRLGGDGEAWRLRVVLARVQPARFRWGLRRLTRAGGELGAWTVDSAAAGAALAVNAGQFEGGTPWGWLVADGVERQPPGVGPLSMAVVVDTSGAVRLVPSARIAEVRRRGGIAQAFQSYPALLVDDGRVPDALRGEGRGVDLRHRDARLAIGELRDGRILIALTRFEGLGGALEVLPFGPTTPEMAAVMGALGCRQAVLLDGGISSQMLLRAPGGTRAWRGMRRVPLALEVVAR